MTQLSHEQLTSYAQQAGFSGVGLQTIVAIAMAESGGNTQAQNCNNPNGTCDRGVLQINNHFHSEVTDACAYDPACSFKAAFKISNSGINFSPWTTFTSGAYGKFLGNSQQSTSTPTSSSSSSSGSGTTGGSVCDAFIIGGIICSDFFENGVIVVIGILIAIVALIGLLNSRKGSS